MDKQKLFTLGFSTFSLILSLSLWFFGDKQSAIYVGLWVSAVLTLGQYKIK